MLWFFLFFLVSGFCSVLYEIVWLRLAMAQFGVTSAMVSIVLSVFMAGLGLGSWVSGRLLRRYANLAAPPALRIYALTEFLIGTSALLVPHELLWGRAFLERAGLSSSAAFYFASGLCVALALVPWCASMGATIPVAMLAIKRSFQAESSGSFSYLYFSNVLGAVGGALLPPLLVEIFGFHGTLSVGMVLNYLLCLSALALSARRREAQPAAPEIRESVPSGTSGSQDIRALILLFTTGLTSMGMEVVWIRQFTPYLGTMVYSFALILAVYLAATFAGSCLYRQRRRSHQFEGSLTWALLALFAVLPVVMADPHFNLGAFSRIVLGIGPFSGILGFVTPLLVDRWSGGDPDRAGTAYAVNVVGCILGPLLSGFLLLPYLSEHWVQGLFSLPWLAMAAYPEWSSTKGYQASLGKKALSYAMLAEALILVALARDYQERFPASSWVLRDDTATVIAYGDGAQKRLLVNGVGMTGLTQITKMMAHLPLAFLDHPPQNALVICFGMGTSYRSLLSWGISVTAAELVPSVPKMFPYFHADARQVLSSPRSRIVIDDGRRYLERSSAHYDVITVDPPPPVQAAGSSLLYTKEFYSIIQQRLAPGGILQQWLPEGDPEVRASVTRALTESFPYVRLFAYNPQWGFHFLASNRPIPQRSPAELAQRMPAAAVRDIEEWVPSLDAEHIFLAVLLGERSPAEMIAASPQTPAMQDDRPFNEYFLIRSLERGQISLERTSLNP
ncbi:MAG TPA: fused MFS/spermidine synthase [Terriglobales bacterium]|nr:fused MFS/spermidine synthase [Terriglobales bacterium]